MAAEAFVVGDAGADNDAHGEEDRMDLVVGQALEMAISMLPLD